MTGYITEISVEHFCCRGFLDLLVCNLMPGMLNLYVKCMFDRDQKTYFSYGFFEELGA